LKKLKKNELNLLINIYKNKKNKKINMIKVTKRNGKKEPLMLDKILDRINQQTYGLDQKWIVPFEVAQKVIEGITPDIKTSVLDQLAMETAASLTTKHPDYSILAARLAITNLHKETKKSFSETVEDLYKYVDPKTGRRSPIVSENFYKIVKKYADDLDSAIVHSRDHNFDYFGFKTLEKSYLLKINGKVAERPQYMYMRTAIQIWGENIDKVIETYNILSEGYYTHATPTLFNSGTARPQLSSCFVSGTQVFTKNGPKNIEDVVIGDQVVTHLGNTKRVVQLHKNKLNDRKIYSVKVLGSPRFEVTGNHRFWSISKEQLDSGLKPSFNTIEYLKKGDYISIPNSNNKYIPKILNILDYINDSNGDVNLDYTDIDNVTKPVSPCNKNHNSNDYEVEELVITEKHSMLKKEILIDDKFAFILGLWLSDGDIMVSKNKEETTNFETGISITVKKDNYNLISLLQKNLFEIFRLESTVTKPVGNFVKVQLYSMSIGALFSKIFDSLFNKEKLPEFIYDWDKNMCNRLIEGIIASNGCISIDGVASFTMTNVKLVKSLFSIFRNNGIMCHYNEMSKLNNGTIEKNSTISFNVSDIDISNILKIYDDSKLDNLLFKKSIDNSIIEINGNKFIQITDKILSESKPDYVYTLGIEDDHSYVVEGVVAENCFLLDTESDSIEGIFNTLKESAQISKNAGGIGISFNKVRAKGTYIAGTNGTSNGIIPFLKIFNETARAVDQGGGKRKGSIAIYIEPWHADVIEFLDLRKNQGKDELRARDLFLAMWMNDLFMERVELDEYWSLMCPHECIGLNDTYGDEFRDLYIKYEKEGRYKKRVKAREVWNKILESQIETGTPYILYKDTINEKSNQSNIGVIRSSNLCAEIVESTGVTKIQTQILNNKELLDKLGLSEFWGEESVNETAVCNLASISLPKFVNKNKTYNYNKLYEIAYKAIVNLNNVIDVNYYPSKAAKFSNLLHRPVGLGVQGLADVFFLMGIPYDSEEAKQINRDIFETIYYASMRASCDIAKKDGPYATYEGSPVSKGKLQFDLWGIKPSKRWDWDKLKEDIKKWGVRNSLTTCIMPTASTASILGNEASCEAQTSNMYTRGVLSGTFIIVNKYLVKELVKLGIWNDSLRKKIITENGSVQNIKEIPTNLKEIFKTVYEIKQKDVIDMAADRGAFIDQTQSMNIFMDSPNFAKLTSMHFYGWGRRNFTFDQNGQPIIPIDEGIQVIYDKDGKPRCYRDKKLALKTGMYYLRNKSASDAVKFTIQEEVKKTVDERMSEISCSLDNPDECLACGS
jgi:ribonucleoside-diphosphate reductase alpha chain